MAGVTVTKEADYVVSYPGRHYDIKRGGGQP